MGLSIEAAWRISPRSLRLATKARHEADLDELEQRVQASYAGEWFHRTKKLGPEALKKMLPKRKRSGAATSQRPLTMEEEIARQDAWAHGINRAVARQEKARIEQEAKAAAKAAAREERLRKREQRQCL